MKFNFYFALFLSILIVYSCNKDENDNLSGGSGDMITTSLTGRVVDATGAALTGATVTSGGKSCLTDVWGIYYLENVSLNKKRDVIRVSAPGKWDQICGFIPTSSSLNYVNAGMNSLGAPFSVNGVTGGQVNLSGNVSISFPANAFISSSGSAYTGTVAVTAMSLSPDVANFDLLAPGGDFIGDRANGDEVILLSYGMVSVVLTDNTGNEIKLAAGKKAVISFPIVSSHQSAAPASIPLWYLDEQTGRWKEEGLAVKSGNTYTGEVSHFTIWNFDDFRPAFTINGQVTDSCGNPLANAFVAVHSQSPNAGGHGCTDINGYFSGYAPANEPLYVFVSTGYYGSVPLATLPAQLPGTVYTASSPYFTSNPNPALATCKVKYTGRVLNCNLQPKIAPVIFLDSLNNYYGHTWSNANGNFTFQAMRGFVKIISYSGLYYTSLDTSVFSSPLVNIGDLVLCDPINMNNNFQLTFVSSLGTLPLSFLVSSCNVNEAAGEISIQYVDSANSGVNSTFLINTPSYAPAAYPWNVSGTSISGSVQYLGQNYTISSSDTGMTTLQNTPAAGGQIMGNFSGNVTLSRPGGFNINGVLSGNFNIYRSN